MSLELWTSIFIFIPDGFNCFSEEQHYSHITTCTERECQARCTPTINNLLSLLQETSSKKVQQTDTHITAFLSALSVTQCLTPPSSTFSFQKVYCFLPLFIFFPQSARQRCHKNVSAVDLWICLVYPVSESILTVQKLYSSALQTSKSFESTVSRKHWGGFYTQFHMQKN